MFLLGYLLIGLFGGPDFLAGGSVFVRMVDLLLNRITNQVIENEHPEGALMAAEDMAENAEIAADLLEMEDVFSQAECGY